MFSILHSKSSTRIPWFTVSFDSSAGMVNALANCLHQKGFPGVGILPESELLAKLINVLPWKLKKNAYIKGSAKGAISPAKLSHIQLEEFNTWITNKYPQRKYPAIMIGSSNGAAIHLAAAMGIPWIPQTFLIPVKSPGHLSVDEPITRMEWAKGPAKALLDANPDLQLHHMMDPNQDRPMLETTSYFRVKQIGLGKIYKDYIREHLEKDGTLIIINCEKQWPATYAADRYYFQFGGFGGTTITEYLSGSNGVQQFLKKAGAAVNQWQVPEITGEMPESEWGFAPQIMEDITKLAKENHYKIQQLQFNEPEDLSPYVADLYRWWYQQQGIPDTQLLIGTFFLIEPFLTLYTGAIPFWMAFNSKNSVDVAKEYAHHTSFDQIYLMPFNHGVEGQGLATVENYQELFRLAKHNGDFIGSEPELYPFDFGIYFRYEKDIKKKLKTRFPVQASLTLDQVNQFYQQALGKYKINWKPETF